MTPAWSLLKMAALAYHSTYSMQATLGGASLGDPSGCDLLQ